MGTIFKIFKVGIIKKGYIFNIINGRISMGDVH